MAETTARTVRRFPESGNYLTFVAEFLLKNEPCIFPAAVTSEWRARREWQRDGKPDLDYLAAQFGDARVPVADCSKKDFDSHSKTDMKMADYLHYWRGLMPQRGSPEGCETKQTDGLERNKEDIPLLYLKDWHFVKQYPEYGAYSVPSYFTSDWLNEVWDLREDVTDDYRFVYFGPKGTWTPFHADVFRSYSWSANVCGRKEWLLFPPGQEDKLRDRSGRLPFDLRRPDTHPRCDAALRVIQEVGEVIFVPSGWYHQVHNLEDTISINHNWVNAFGLQHMWKHVHSELQEVKRELADCRDMSGWETHCQVVLCACVGIDYRELLQMLCLLALPRLTELDSVLPSSTESLFTPLRQHITTVSHCGELRAFGDTIYSRQEAVVVGDRLREVLDRCDLHSTGCVVDSLPEDLQMALNSTSDELIRTLCSFRIFELHQINSVLTELVTDSDMQALIPLNVILTQS